MATATDVTAVIVAYNSTHMLAECLAGLRANAVNRVIVVDNASSDDAGSWCARHAPQVTVIGNARNQGYGRANNIGVRAAATEFCLLLNPDARLEAGAVAALLAAADRYPDVALFGPAIIEKTAGREHVLYSARTQLSGYLPNPAGVLTVPSGEASTPFLMGACYLLRRDAFLKLGGFDPNIFLYYEDDDLCRRMSDRHLGPVFVPSARVRHGGTESSRPRRGLKYLVHWHRAWSRLYVMRKYGLKQGRVSRIALRVLRDGIKAVGAIGKPEAMRETRRGAFMGALSFALGRTARRQQGLD